MNLHKEDFQFHWKQRITNAEQSTKKTHTDETIAQGQVVWLTDRLEKLSEEASLHELSCNNQSP